MPCQAIIWFLARWSSTYLMLPEEGGDKSSRSQNDCEPQLQSEHSRKAFRGFFGEHNQGKVVLDIVVRISMTTLVSYPGEKDLQVSKREVMCNIISTFITFDDIF